MPGVQFVCVPTRFVRNQRTLQPGGRPRPHRPRAPSRPRSPGPRGSSSSTPWATLGDSASPRATHRCDSEPLEGRTAAVLIAEQWVCCRHCAVSAHPVDHLREPGPEALVSAHGVRGSGPRHAAPPRPGPVRRRLQAVVAVPRNAGVPIGTRVGRLVDGERGSSSMSSPAHPCLRTRTVV
ncbi:hypothetical protein GN956_G17807 [Arapaima gigas]